MKKKLLGLTLLALSLVTVLAACAPGQGGLVYNLTTTSNYWTSPGNYVVCDNLTTDIVTSFGLIAGENVDRIEVELYGHAQEETDTVVFRRGDIQVNGNIHTFTIRLAPTASPFFTQDVTGQGIIVVPVDPADPPAPQGSVTLTYRIHFQDSETSQVYRNQATLPVWGGCEEAEETPDNLSAHTNYWFRDGGDYEYVVCDNLTTRIDSTFSMVNANRINRIEISARGEAQGITETWTVTSGQLSISSGRVSFTNTLGPSASPFSDDVSTQAIIVRPTDPAARQGTLRLTYTVHLNNGTTHNLGTRNFAVWGGCQLDS